MQLPTKLLAVNDNPVGIIVVKFLIYIIITYAATDVTFKYPANKKTMFKFHHPKHSKIAPYNPICMYSFHLSNDY